MATRFHLNADTAPAVSPALQSYTHTDETVTPKRQLLVTDTSALSTRAYTPDAADHLVAGTALLGQFVSNPMDSGIAFNNGQAIVFAVQCLEANAGNNVAMRIWAGIYSEDGSTLRRELRAVVSEGTELATTLTGRHLSTVQSGANYTTVAGDRLVVEFSVTGTPSAAGGVQGHNASLRIGGNGAGGDVTADDLDTGTTKNGWVEFTPTITFPSGDATATPATVAAVSSVPAPTVQGAAVGSPSTVVGTGSVPAPTASGAGVTSPSAVAAIGAVPAPTATGTAGGDATATPATVAAIGAVPASIARGAAVTSPATVAGVAAVPTATAQGAARATPAQVTGVGSVPTVTAQGGGRATPVTVTAITTIPSSTGRGAGVATPTTVAALGDVPPPFFPGLIDLVFLTEGDADALATMQGDGAVAASLELDTAGLGGIEGDSSKPGSIEAGTLVGAGLEG